MRAQVGDRVKIKDYDVLGIAAGDTGEVVESNAAGVRVRLDRGGAIYLRHHEYVVIPKHPLEMFTEEIAKGIWPTEEDIGRGVVYVAHPGAAPEDGVVTSFNDRVVFVRYASQHPGASGKATRREDLRWLSGEDR